MPDIREQEQAAVNSVLASKTFAKCQNLAKLLQYLCHEYQDGCAANLKEYNIGIEALGRTPDFDPTENSIVRVEVHRLREKLKKYYQEEGAGDPWMISLQPGIYSPQFVRREAAPHSNEAVAAGESAAGQGNPEIAAPASALKLLGGPAGAPRRSSDASVSRLRLVYGAAVAGVALVAIMFAVHAQGLFRSKALPLSAVPLNGLAAAKTASHDTAIRILSGYTKAKYVDRAGQIWLSDRYYSGGQRGIQTARFFLRTLDPTLFETYRFGDFAYNIPLAAGTYELRLYFTETGFGPDTISGGGESSRLFTVALNGKLMLANFDILSDADGTGVADVRVFKDVAPAPDGYLHLKFERDISDPLVSAIEVAPAPPGRMNPIRIVAEDDSFTDNEGRFWNPDCYFAGGRLALRKVRVEGTRDPGLYGGERFGHFDYAIPVAPGRYRVTLSFAETFFGADNPGGGGAGSRAFDVYCNGTALLRRFDIFKEAGGANRALQKVFDGLEPNAQGKLILRFVPVENYACVNAIEVVDESK